jgi:hypothetical protein
MGRSTVDLLGTGEFGKASLNKLELENLEKQV